MHRLSLRHWSIRHAGTFERLYGWFLRVAPALRAVVGWLGTARAEFWVKPVERGFKSLFFGCRMCGQCVLSASGMACPMNCPKQLRNGPCGEVSPQGRCEVDPALRCVWLEAFEGAGKMRDRAAILRVQPAVDRRLEGSSTWIRTIVSGDAPREREDSARAEASDRSPLEQACRSGRFVVTAEVSPPDSADPEDLLRRARPLRGLVDALNVTDNAAAHCHMSSLAASALLARDGHQPVFQIACRDRNRLAMQADILGAAALGVRNLLCITGDDVAAGDHPQARAVFDLDAVSLLETARGLRDRGSYASGRKIAGRPALFLGATANPFAPPFADRVVNLQRKLAAGAQFIQTQYCLDLARLQAFLERMRDAGLDRRCHVLVGVGPLVSLRMARWLATRVPGVHVPDGVLRRLERSGDVEREGMRICVETIQALREMRGVSGVHLMVHRREDLISQLLAAALPQVNLQEGVVHA